MQFVRLGRSSLRVSRLSPGAMGFGDTSWRSWVLALEESRAIFRRATEHGLNVIATRGGGAGPLWDLCSATTGANPIGKAASDRGYSRKHLLEAVERSLRRLQNDYIDL